VLTEIFQTLKLDS